MKVIVMDYGKAVIRVIGVDDHHCSIDEVELLGDNYGYNFSQIDYMIVPEFKLEVD
jgi:hypothetical protein